MAFANYTAPGLTLEEGKGISEVLQARLHDLNDHLLLKHAHWNVTGPGFIAVHEMIDPRSTPSASSSTPSQSVWQPWAQPQRPGWRTGRTAHRRGLPRRPRTRC